MKQWSENGSFFENCPILPPPLSTPFQKKKYPRLYYARQYSQGFVRKFHQNFTNNASVQPSSPL